MSHTAANGAFFPVLLGAWREPSKGESPSAKASKDLAAPGHSADAEAAVARSGRGPPPKPEQLSFRTAGTAGQLSQPDDSLARGDGDGDGDAPFRTGMSAPGLATPPWLEDPASPTERKGKPVSQRDFELLGTLGKGSFGAVYAVAHRRSQQRLAMKVMDKQQYTSNEMLPYAVLEKNCHAYLLHPFIVKLHHAFQTKTTLVMLTEYCPGGNLFRLIQQQTRLPEGLARLYAAETSLALGHLHRFGIIHRDLKSANIVIDDERHALLTDFGLAKEGISGAADARSFAGTLHYLAPEVLARTGHGFPIDVYNLGCMVYEMLTGCIPYYSTNKELIKANILAGVLEVPACVSAVACRFIQETMDRDPLDRPGGMNIAELREHAFFQGLDFDRVFHREVEVPQLARPQPVPMLRRLGRKGAAVDECFFADRRPTLADKVVAGWDYSEEEPFGGRELLMRRATTSERLRRASCLMCFWHRANSI